MKWRVAAIIFAVLSAQAQGTFQNLDFESAMLPSVPPGQSGGTVPISAAIPDWIGYFGSAQVTDAFHNDTSLGAPEIDILGPQWNGGPGIIDEDYSVYLQPGEIGTTVSIAQSGTVPSGSQTLMFDAWQPPFATPFSVSFGGDPLFPVVLSSGQSASGQAYNVYGASIASFAGQTGQLEFTVYPNNYNSLLLDDISFSPTAVIPEPSPLALTGIGGLLFALYRRIAPKCP
jgi:hypothetical protein